MKWIIIAFVALAVLSAAFGEDDDSSSKAPAEVTTQSEAKTATEAATEATTEVKTEATTKTKKKTTKAEKTTEPVREYKRELWNPDITYDQLARTPDDYNGEDITFEGVVIQVMEGDGETQLRIAVGGDYDKIMLIGYNPAILSSRVLENDQIRFYGTSIGLITYQSTMGGNITIPAATVEHIDIH